MSSLAFSPDGKLLITGSSGGASIWEVNSGRELRRLGQYSESVHAVAASRDGRSFITGVMGKAQVWDRASGKELPALVGHDGWVTAVVAAGRLLLTATSDGVVLWELDKGAVLQRLQLPGLVRAAALSPDGLRIALGLKDGTLRLYRAADGAELQRIAAHKEALLQVVFSPDGRFLASSAEVDGAVRLWDPASGRAVRSMEGHDGWVNAVAWSLDSRLLATGHYKSAAVWDPATGEELRRLRGNIELARAVAISPDSTIIATGANDGITQLWDLATGRELRRLQRFLPAVSSIAVSADGRLVVTGLEDGTARLFESATGQERHRFVESDAVVQVAISDDGTLVATRSFPQVGDSDNMVRLWEVASGGLRAKLTGHRDLVTGVAISPGGKWVATTSRDRRVRIFDAARGQELRHLPEGEHELTAVAFSRDGMRLATGSARGEVQLWDVATGRELRRLPQTDASVAKVAFGGEGGQIVAILNDGTARAWDTERGTLRKSLPVNDGRVTGIGAGGKLLASFDSRVHLTELATGRDTELQQPLPEEAAITALAISGDGRLMVTGAQSGVVQLLDRATGRELGSRRAGPAGWAASFGGRLYRSDDGRLLYDRRPEDGAISPVLPPRPPREPLLTAAVIASGPLGDAAAASVRIRISNDSAAGRAYWLHLSAPALPAGVNLILPATHQRLEPGESIELPVGVTALTPAGREPRPTRASFTLQLHHAFGDGPAVATDLDWQAPALAVTEALLTGSRADAQVLVRIRNEGSADAATVMAEGCVLAAAPQAPGVEASCLETVTQQRFAAGQLAAQRDVTMSIAVPRAQRGSVGLYLQPPRIRVKLRGSLWPTHLWVHEVQTRRPPGLYLAAVLVLLALLLGSVGLSRWRRVVPRGQLFRAAGPAR